MPIRHEMRILIGGKIEAHLIKGTNIRILREKTNLSVIAN